MRITGEADHASVREAVVKNEEKSKINVALKTQAMTPKSKISRIQIEIEVEAECCECFTYLGTGLVGTTTTAPLQVSKGAAASGHGPVCSDQLLLL